MSSAEVCFVLAFPPPSTFDPDSEDDSEEEGGGEVEVEVEVISCVGSERSTTPR